MTPEAAQALIADVPADSLYAVFKALVHRMTGEFQVRWVYAAVSLAVLNGSSPTARAETVDRVLADLRDRLLRVPA